MYVKQLAQGCYLKVGQSGVEPATFCFASQHPNHYSQQSGRQRHTDHAISIAIGRNVAFCASDAAYYYEVQ